MKKRTASLLVSAMLTLGSIACGGGDSPQDPPGESNAPSTNADTDKERDWNVEPSERGGSFDAPESTRKALGVARWKFTTPSEGLLVAEGLDGNGAMVGRLEMNTDQAARKVTITLNLKGQVSTGVIVWNEKDEIIENTVPQMGEGALAWIKIVGEDADAFLAANTTAYGGVLPCIASVAVGLISLGTLLGCATGIGCVVAAAVIVGAGTAAQQACQ